MQRPRVQSVMETHHIKQSLGKNEDHQLRPHLSLTLFFLPWKANSFLVRFNSIFCSNLNSSHPPSNACPHSQNEQIPYQRFWQLLIYSLHCLNHIKYQLLFYLFCLDPLNTRFFMVNKSHQIPVIHHSILPQLHCPRCPTGLARLQRHVWRWTSTESRSQGCGIGDFLLSKASGDQKPLNHSMPFTPINHIPL